MSIKEIIEVLNEQNELCESLIDLSKKITSAVKENNIDEINRLVKLEIAAAMKFSSFEKDRDFMVKEYMNEKGHKENEINLTQIKKYVDEEVETSLNEIGDKLSRSIGELYHINQTNNKLLKSKLDWVDFSLQILNNSQAKTYNSKSKTKPNDTGLINELI